MRLDWQYDLYNEDIQTATALGVTIGPAVWNSLGIEREWLQYEEWLSTTTEQPIPSTPEQPAIFAGGGIAAAFKKRRYEIETHILTDKERILREDEEILWLAQAFISTRRH